MTASAAPGYPAEPPHQVSGPPQSDEVPAPRGPGVTPPFTVPPTDRDSRSVWIGLGVTALVLVLCCVGGLVGVGVLFAGGVREAKTQARQTVEEYLGALRRSDYRGAYHLLCESRTQDESLATFTRRSQQDPVTGFTTGAVTDANSELVVAATVQYTRQGSQPREYLVQAAFGEYTVCGER
jgi:hypothetical protein